MILMTISYSQARNILGGLYRSTVGAKESLALNLQELDARIVDNKELCKVCALLAQNLGIEKRVYLEFDENAHPEAGKKKPAEKAKINAVRRVVYRYSRDEADTEPNKRTYAAPCMITAKDSEERTFLVPASLTHWDDVKESRTYIRLFVNRGLPGSATILFAYPIRNDGETRYDVRGTPTTLENMIERLKCPDGRIDFFENVRSEYGDNAPGAHRFAS